MVVKADYGLSAAIHGSVVVQNQRAAFGKDSWHRTITEIYSFS
jgi:hypothetical protein